MTLYISRYKAFGKMELTKTTTHNIYNARFQPFPHIAGSDGRHYRPAFRELCAEFGADFTYTEMISAKGLFYDSKNTRDLLALCDLEAPCGIQLLEAIRR